MNEDAIGGYFGLELPAAHGELLPDAMCFQSSRAAFLALLRAHRPTAVWMPWYVCDSMLEPVRTAGIPIRRYEIDDRFRVVSASPTANEWLLYVNYFGLCANNVDDVLHRFSAEQVIIDNSQAFFAGPEACLATLYSPRKFFGVPDGGYLVTKLPVPIPEDMDDGSAGRSAHLLKRWANGAEAGYADYASAEAGLHLQEPKQMSALTRQILARIDYADVRARRIANFAFLDTALRHINRPVFDESGWGDGAPLCYPLFGAPDGTRDALARERVYTPCYWPDVAVDHSAPRAERRIAESALFLPCDQRLSRPQLERVAYLLLKRLEQS
ncbi:hypothetical protein [Paraburkholderia sp. GAS42]|uniref:hypothetical protein n=1 Tax=Paraburkholderia sp. GAS42 TaxID=3035135 RepID=UPI003D1BE562